MTITRYIASGIAAVGLLSASTAFAGEATRSASALPTAKHSLKKVSSVKRAGKKVTDGSYQTEESAAAGTAAGGGISTTAIVVGVVAAAAVAGGVVAATSASNG